MNSLKSLSSYKLGAIDLNNRIVMAPMTRSRATTTNIPTPVMATYYKQRATAGLIITEGVSPSPNGLGYARIPGVFSDAQTQAWKVVAAATHSAGGKIFMQLMHTGRVAHAYNLSVGGRVLAPSAIPLSGQMWTDKGGLLDFTPAVAMDEKDLRETKLEYVQAALNAIEAGFDGVELHGANGYLLEQFLSPHSNRREDAYGGSVENRSRFVLEVADAVSNAIGKDKTGIRLSPYGIFNDMPHYPEVERTYAYLAEELNKIGLVYIHLVDHSAGGAPEVPVTIKETIRAKFQNTLILSGGYTQVRAEQDVSSGFADLVAFGKPFIANPDLADRLLRNRPLNITLDASTFYTPGEKGYTDYPVFDEETVTA